MRNKYRILAVVCLVLFAGLSYVIYQTNKGNEKQDDDTTNNTTENNNNNETGNETTKALTYLSISINPDVELAVNDSGVVEEVLPINADADVITSDLNLVGNTVEDASAKIVDAAVETGYIDEYSTDNTVVVTTAGDDDAQTKNIQDRVMTKLNEHFESRKIYPVLVAKGLTDDLKADADKYNISNGKMLLIDYAVALDPTLSKDTLATKSIKDIQATIKTYVKARHDALKKSLAAAKADWLAKKQQLKQQYQAKIEALKASITEEQKAAFKNMTPAQKEAAIQKILDAKRAAIKATVSDVKAEIKSDMSGYNYPVLKNNAETIKQNIKERIQQRTNR